MRALMFPGQGSQNPAMFDKVQSPWLSQLLSCATDLSEIDLTPTEKNLEDTRVAQVLIYLSSVVRDGLLKFEGKTAHAVAGHSIGEYASIVSSGALTIRQGLELVTERARCMHEVVQAEPGAMTAVIMNDPKDLALIEGIVNGIEDLWVANYNSPTQVVISGRVGGLIEAEKQLDSVARRLVRLNVAGAFHTPLMKPAADKFAAVLDKVEFRDTLIPVLQNTDPTPSTSGGIIRGRLANQIDSPVQWTGVIEQLCKMQLTHLVEVGYGSVLKGFVRGTEFVYSSADESLVA